MDNLLGVYEGASSSSADRDEAKKLDVIAVSFDMHTAVRRFSALCMICTTSFAHTQQLLETAPADAYYQRQRLEWRI